MRLDQDNHVHSTWSDGQHTPEEMLAVAAERGIRVLGFADHVRRDTTWLGDYCDKLDALRSTTDIEIVIGVEVKILTTDGDIDIPDELHSLERVIISDHQIPGADGPLHPKAVAASIEDGSRTAAEVLDDIIRGTANAVLRSPRAPVVGHLFSILPKVGIEEPEDLSLLDPLWEACVKRDAPLEIDERWRCPSARIALSAQKAGVRVIASTDAHKAPALGKYKHVTAVSEALAEQG